MDNCSQVAVHQIFIFFQDYSTPNFVALSSHAGLRFIKYHNKHSPLLYTFCYPAVVGYHAVSTMLLFVRKVKDYLRVEICN